MKTNEVMETDAFGWVVKRRIRDGKRLAFLLLLLVGFTFAATTADWTIDGDRVYWAENGYEISASPHTSRGMSATQYVNFSSINPTSFTGNFSFVFSPAIISGSAELWMNTNHQYTTPIIGRVDKSTTINVVSYTATNSTNCFIGDLQNTLRYNITYTTGSNTTSNIGCFNSYTQNGSIYTLYYQENETTGHQTHDNYYMDWQDISSQFTTTMINDHQVFTINNVLMQQGTNHQVRFKYSVKMGTSGKYDIYVHGGTPEQVVAGTAPIYLKLDPWYNSSYVNKQRIDITNWLCEQTYCQFPIFLTLNGTNGSDITFTNSAENAELYFWRSTDWNYTSASGTIWLNASNATSAIYLYYNYPGAPDKSNIDKTFWVGEDFLGTSLNTTKWVLVGTEGIHLNITNGYAYLVGLAGSPNQRYIKTSTNITEFVAGYSAYFRMNTSDQTGESQAGMTVDDGDAAHFYTGAADTNYAMRTRNFDGTSTTWGTSNVNRLGSMNRFEVDWQIQGGAISYLVNDSIVDILTGNKPDTDVPLHFRTRNTVLQIDYVFVRSAYNTSILPNFTISASEIDTTSCGNLSQSDMPATLNCPNMVYNLTESVTQAGATAITVLAENVTLNCVGFSITGNNATNMKGVYSTMFNTTISNCVVSSFPYGIYFNGATYGTILNTNATGSTNRGIYLASGSNHNTIINSIGTSTSQSGIDLSTNSNNTITNSVGASIGGINGISLSSSNNNTIINSTGTSTTKSGIKLSSSSYNQIINCVGDANEDGLTLSESHYNTISNCIFIGSTTAGIDLVYSGTHHNTFNNVTAISPAVYGILLATVSNNTFTNVTGIGGIAGMHIDYSNDNSISNSYFMGNGLVDDFYCASELYGAVSFDCISAGTSSGNSFTNNTVVANVTGIAAISLSEATTTNNIISGNTLTADIWINNSGASNTFVCNHYKFANGQEATSIYPVYDSSGDQCADFGNNLPYYYWTMPNNWVRLGYDYSPYTNLTSAQTGTLVQILVVDNSFKPVLNTSVKIIQINAANNTNSTLGLFTVDEFGTTTVSLLPLTMLYAFSVYNQNGSTLIQAFQQTGLSCTTSNILCKHTLVLNINSVLPFYIRNNLVGACSYNNSSLTINCQANDPTNTLNNYSLQAFAQGNTTQACFNSSTGSSANLNCTLPAACGYYNYVFLGSDGIFTYTLSADTITANGCASTTTFGRSGWVAMLLIFGTIALVGSYSLPVAMMLGVMSLFFGMLVQLIPWTAGTPIIIFLVIALIIAYRSKV